MEPQSFSFSRKRAHSCRVTQEEVRFEGPQEKAPPLSRRRRRMRPPTPLQNSYSSFEEEEGHFEVEDQMWSARDRTIIAKTKQYLEESKSLRVEIEELEFLLGPEDTDVDFRRILEEARDEKRFRHIFETFRTDGPSELLVVSRSRWDTKGGRTHRGDQLRPLHQVKDSGKRIWKTSELDGARWKERSWAVEDYLEKFRQYKSGHRVLGELHGARRRRGLSEVHPEVLDERRHGSQHSKKVGRMSGMIFSYRGVMAKAPPCPERTLKTPLPQQSSPSFRDEEGQWVAMEDRRSRRIAFEKTAKRVMM